MNTFKHQTKNKIDLDFKQNVVNIITYKLKSNQNNSDKVNFVR